MLSFSQIIWQLRKFCYADNLVSLPFCIVAWFLAIVVTVQMIRQRRSPAGSLAWLLAVVGSANFDMRSLFLNYETGLLVYSKAEIQEIRKWIEALAPECRCGVPEVGLLRDLGEGVSCLLAPIL